jgi:pimeloyl-ACP methyl ester carboxylesterase
LPYITLKESPLANRKNVQLYYREFGRGTIPLIFLHGGWGYQVYPFDKQVEAFADQFRILIPDRSGYGKSERIDSMPPDFHLRAAIEMKNFLDALDLDRVVLWGHSDGSVISVHMGLAERGRFYGIVLEAFHFFRNKPGSHEFFEMMMNDPGTLGERVVRSLIEAHGEDRWEKLIRLNGTAWLHIAEAAQTPNQDLYDGRLAELRVPSIAIHGGRDPRTEPDELAMAHQQLPTLQISVIEGGGHSPHSEGASASECIRLARQFFDSLAFENSLLMKS